MASSSKFLEPDFLPRKHEGWQARWFDTIFHHEQGASRNFDVALIVAILLSVTVVILDSEAELHARFGYAFYVLEWAFTLLFTVEYVLRLYL
ncbi:MAG: ion transporter, partial [Luteimonas sp.]